MENPEDRKYSKEHEWCKVENGIATIGLTGYAQHSLTDIVFVELPKEGQDAEQGKPMCVVESVKSVSDIYAPVSGKVVETNKNLESNPEPVNKDPFGEGWIAKIKIEDETQLQKLMDSKQYTAFTEEEKKK